MSNPISRRSFISVGALASFAAVAGLTGCSGGSSSSASSASSAASGAPSKVIIGQQGLLAEVMPIQEGYYEAEMPNVTIDVKQFSAGRDLIRSLTSGDIDFAVVGSLPTALGLCQGSEYKVIYAADIITTTESLIVQNSANINSLADLEGKKVATTFASTAHYSLLNALAKEGVDQSKIEILDMEPDKILAAWQRGDIDAGYTWEPVRSNLVANDGKVLLTSGEVGEMGYPTADFVLVRTGFAEQYPDYVESYMKAFTKAADMLTSDPDTAYASIAKFQGMTADEVKAAMTDKYVPSKDQLGADYLGGGFATMLVDSANYLKEQGEVTTAITADQAKAAVDSSYLEKVVG